MAEPVEIVEANVRAPYYFISAARWTCRQCTDVTPVHALMLPEMHEMLIDDGWDRLGLPARMFYVDYLSISVQQRVFRTMPHYWLDQDEAIGFPYFMNHCERCGAKQTDRALHEEYPGAFCSAQWEPTGGVGPIVVHEPLTAHAAGFVIEQRTGIG